MDKTCDEFSGKCYRLKADFPGPEQQQQDGDDVNEVEPALALEKDCLPGARTPGVDNCHEKEKQAGMPVTRKAKPAAAAVTKPNCNPAQPCIAGIPVAGIGCCTEEERAIQRQFEAQHKPVEVLAVPLSRAATQQK
jgi:hypothetical protein